ncbi:CHAT domain-containing tetratricopeptide repeat protein [Paraburkholderia sp. MM5384-R2]|uniref:CHAT domain-containing protein n=1 Tax=Paraburkholderia sp. MM5384-R2 TaxID=2723097 RepID=UPI00161A9230|nr:CHAT domain-containing tetratricopeptide repeat protein [Paraburkholderia sp. MM5384-R2]MBB5502175.1 CHAT domain-containing protein [Paraburkholderia sp. MM5384-R2]
MKAKSNVRLALWFTTVLLTGCSSGALTRHDEAAKMPLSTSAQPILQPPRNTNDMLTEIRTVKGNEATLQRLTAMADASAPPEGQSPVTFYWKRAGAAEQIGRPEQALADLRTAYEQTVPTRVSGVRRDVVRELANAESAAGNFETAIELMQQALREVPKSIGNYETLSAIYASMGDTSNSRNAGRRAQQLMTRINQSDPPQEWRAPTVEYLILESDGQWRKAEPYIRDSITAYEDSARKDRTPNWIEKRLLHLSTNLVMQGRYDEAEAIDRQVIRRLLHRVGRNNLDTVDAILALGEAVYARNHIADALRLSDEAVAILDEMKVPPDARQRRLIEHFKGRIFLAEGDLSRSLASFEQAKAALPDDDFFARSLFQQSPDAILSLAANGQSARALPLASNLVELRRSMYGEGSREWVEAGAIHAFALVHAGQSAAAIAEFDVFAQHATNRGGDNGFDHVRYRLLTECYVGMLFDASAHASDGNARRQMAEQAFVMADSAREGEVRRAIQASSARAAASSSQTGNTVRQEQDLSLRASALRVHLATLSATRPSPQILQITANLVDELKQTQQEQESVHKELTAHLGERGDALESPSVGVSAVAKALQSDEALVMTFLTGDRTYIWSVDPSGSIMFRASSGGREQIGRLVASVRATTEIHGDTFASIKPFDFAASHAIYKQVLEPVRPRWEHAHSLVIVPDEALGFVPFALLPVDLPARRTDGQAMFDGYRQVAWLVRTHATSSVPSAAAFVSLRRVSQVTGTRKNFIGFGDPLFSADQPARTLQLSQRGAGTIHVLDTRITNRGALDNQALVSAHLDDLMPLPETADEVRNVARALGADESSDVLLGAAATVRAAKSPLLADRRIVMFATHGLVPGDLDGLEQPALALSNPRVVGGTGDGLLKMDDVLALKLDADWVVLSACNTAAADGAGSEAVSGLGRAFFFAGTRALLATHWAVETESAQELTTQLFSLQRADPTLGRAQALRQAMIAMIDKSGRFRDGKMIVSYAHPLFWAPFALFGDGGGS